MKNIQNILATIIVPVFNDEKYKILSLNRDSLTQIMPNIIFTVKKYMFSIYSWDLYMCSYFYSL